LSYTVRFLRAAERDLDQFDTEVAAQIDLWLLSICEDPGKPPGVLLAGYQPDAYEAEVPGTDVFAAIVIFHASQEVLVLRLESLANLS
jgi:hypothetical protein